MRSAIIVLTAFVATVLAPAAAESSDHTYTIEISPGGAHYAVVRDFGDQRAIAIYDVDNPTAEPMAIGLGNVDVQDFEWGGDDYVMYRISGEKTVSTTNGLRTMTFARWQAISRLTGKSETLFGNEFGSDYYYFIGGSGTLISSLPNDGENALFARSYIKIADKGPTRLQKGSDVVEYSLQAANLKNGGSRLNESGNASTFDWVVDVNGNPVARIDKQGSSGAYRIFAADSKGRFALAGEIEAGSSENGGIGFYGAAAQGAIQVSTEQDGRFQLTGYDLSGGGFTGSLIPPGESADIVQLAYDPRFARVRIAYSRDGRAIHLEEGDRKIQAALEKALPGASVAIESKTLSGGRLIAHAKYADRGDEYYFFDTAAKKLELVAAN